MPIPSPLEATEEEWSAAQRLADSVNIHVLAQNATFGNGRETPGYVAVRLADGTSDGTLYDTRADAVRMQREDPWCFYVKVGRQTMPVQEAYVVLQYARMAKKRGVVFADEEVVLPHRLELAQTLIPRTIQGVRNHRG